MTEHAPISTIVPKSSANLGNSTLSAVHPSAASPLHNSLHRLVSTQPARPRHSNPHSACGSAIPSLSAVSSLGGFRTPAAELAAPALKRPASETLHNSGVRADIPGPPLRAKSGLMHRGSKPAGAMSGLSVDTLLAARLRLPETTAPGKIDRGSISLVPVRLRLSVSARSDK